MDIVAPETRSRMMASVRSANTKPELTLRRALHARGCRFRIHRRDLPGTPDLVFPSRRAVIFVNGCFWHGHYCRAGALPRTRREFWEAKISANKLRDERNITTLRQLGWRVSVVWECELCSSHIIESVMEWLGTKPERPDKTAISEASMADGNDD
jgi:DNA mismatch endonuclease, patch repair protein